MTGWQWQVFWKIHPARFGAGSKEYTTAPDWKTSGKKWGHQVEVIFTEDAISNCRHRCGPGGIQWVGVNQPMEIQKKSCVGAAGGPWGLAVVCGLPEVEALFNVKNSGKTAEFPLAVIPFPSTPRVRELSSSPLINTSRSSRIKIYSHLFIYKCSSCSYNTTIRLGNKSSVRHLLFLHKHL